MPTELRIPLRASGDLIDDAFNRNRAAVGQFRGKGLLFHKVREDTGVGSETGEGETKVGVEGEDLLLVRGEFFCITLGGNDHQFSLCAMRGWRERYFESDQHGVGFANDAHHDGALLDCFLGIFHLEDAALW